MRNGGKAGIARLAHVAGVLVDGLHDLPEGAAPEETHHVVPAGGGRGWHREGGGDGGDLSSDLVDFLNFHYRCFQLTIFIKLLCGNNFLTLLFVYYI